MSVVSVKPREHSGDDFSEDVNYIVNVSAGTDGIATVLAASSGGVSIPAWGATHATRTTLKVTSRKASRIQTSKGASLSWLVQVHYEIPKQNIEPFPGGSNVKWNKTIAFDGEVQMVKTNYDANLKVIKNAAGDVLSDSFEVEMYDQVITVSFSTDTCTWVHLEDYYGKTNASSVSLTVDGVSKTYAAQTLLLRNAPVSADVTPDGVDGWKVQLILVHRKQYSIADGTTEIGWKEQFVEKGYHYFTGSGATLRRVESDHEVYLNTDGTLRFDPNTQVHGSEYSAANQIRQIKKTANFATLLTGV